MADINDDDLAKLTASIQAMQRGIVGYNKALDKQSNVAASTSKSTEKATRDYLAGAAAVADGAKKAAKSVGETAVGIGRNLKGLDAEFGTISRALGMFKSSLSIVASVGVIADVVKDSVDNYRKMIDAGQSFSGSMLQMQIAAAEARMPLADLTLAVTTYSKAMAITGVKAFGEMNKGVRDGLSNFGMLGFKTEELTEYLGDYLEVQRNSGLLDKLNTSESVSIMKRIAIDATRVSEAMGTSRKEILKMTMNTLSEDSVRSKLMMASGAEAAHLQKGLAVAATYLAGLPGEAGKTLSTMMAQTVGRGTSVLSSSFTEFAQVGLGGIGTVMDGINSKIQAGTLGDGDMEAAREEILKMGEANMASLKYMADYAGNATAQKALDMIAGLKSLSANQLKEISAQKKATQFFLNLQSTLQNFTGFFREKFFKAVEGAMGGFEDLADSPVMQTIKEEMGKFAEMLGEWVSDLLKPEKIKEFTISLSTMFKELGEWWTVAKPALADFGNFIIAAVKGINAAISAIGSFVKAIIDAGPAAAIAAVGVMIMAKRAITQFYEGFKESLLGGRGLTKEAMVTGGAMHVRIVGGGGSGGSNDTVIGGDSDAGDRKDNKGKKGKKGNRARRRASARIIPTSVSPPSAVAQSTRTTPSAVAKSTRITPPAVSPSTSAGAGGILKDTAKSSGGLMKGAGSKLGTKAANVLTKVPKGIGLGAIAGIGADMYRDAGGPMGETVGLLGDVASGATTGAMIGSMIMPGVGTAIGAGVGGVGMAAMSAWNNSDKIFAELKSLFGGSSDKEKVKELSAQDQAAMNATNTEIKDALVEQTAEMRKANELAREGVNVQVASTGAIVKSNETKSLGVGSEYNQ